MDKSRNVLFGKNILMKTANIPYKSHNEDSLIDHNIKWSADLNKLPKQHYRRHQITATVAIL